MSCDPEIAIAGAKASQDHDTCRPDLLVAILVYIFS